MARSGRSRTTELLSISAAGAAGTVTEIVEFVLITGGPNLVPHETVPPGDGAERISVAFDVAPAPLAGIA